MNNKYTIARPLYLRKLTSLASADAVKVITGVRRCGKSTLLAIYREYLKEHGTDEAQIIEINFESMTFESLRNPFRLHEYIRAYIEASFFEDGFHLLIDEVQEVGEWAKAINSIRTTFSIDVCVTGSNSRLFAGEDLTYLAGRYVELRMYPLSLREFEMFRNYRNASAPDSSEELFADFISQGSFPAVAASSNPEIRQALLAGLVDSVIVRDVLQRGHIENDSLFRRVGQFVFENIGSEISANRIANTLRTAGYKITTNTVDRYLDLMCDAFVLYRCFRYDIRGRERLRTNCKYYVVDPGLRNAFLGERPRDMGHILENLVYLELLRRGFEVTVGRIDGREIDFVIVDHTERAYLQFCQTLGDSNVEEREFSSLLAVRDAYPKFILSMDAIDYSHDGVTHMNIAEFLRGASLRMPSDAVSTHREQYVFDVTKSTGLAL